MAKVYNAGRRRPRRQRCASTRFAPARCLNNVLEKGEWCAYCKAWDKNGRKNAEEKVMPTIDIVVRRRQDDYYQAFLADNEGVWEAGRSSAEAVGKLVSSACKLIGVSIVEEKREKPSRPKRGKRLSIGQRTR